MEKIKIIKKEAEELLKKMIDRFELEVKEEENAFHIIIKAEEEASVIIGRRGETIRAIQKILEVMFYKKFNQPINILVNVNDYWEKQKERLIKIVEEAAKQVIETQKPVYLKNLSSYERKIVHQLIAENYSQLTSYSQDFGKERRLIIEIKNEESK